MARLLDIQLSVYPILENINRMKNYVTTTKLGVAASKCR